MSLLRDITKLIDRLPEGIQRAEDTITGSFFGTVLLSSSSFLLVYGRRDFGPR